MVIHFEHSVEANKAWAFKRPGDKALWGLVCVTLLCGPSCAKREAQAPKPEPAAERPSDQAEEAPAPAAAQTSWPQALDRADDYGDEAEADSKEKDRAAKQQAAPEAQAPMSESARRQKAEVERKPTRPASAPAKENVAAGAPAPAGNPLAQWSHSVAQLEKNYDLFQDAIALSTPDCPAADKFRQTVCTLAERICSLEEQLPATTKRRCEDGRQRCEQALQKYRARCD